jgi:hypothetical protein
MEEDGSLPKRRRIIGAGDDDDDDGDDDETAAAPAAVPGGDYDGGPAQPSDDDDGAGGGSPAPAAANRRALLERRAADRRRRRLLAEAAELRDDTGADADVEPMYPGDTRPLREDDPRYADDDADLDDADYDDDVDQDLDMDGPDADYIPEDEENGGGRGSDGPALRRGGSSSARRRRGGVSSADGILPLDEEEGEGEDLIENAARDYQRIEALDTYGREGIDDRDYGQMGAEERTAAEAELARREVSALLLSLLCFRLLAACLLSGPSRNFFLRSSFPQPKHLWSLPRTGRRAPPSRRPGDGTLWGLLRRPRRG